MAAQGSQKALLAEVDALVERTLRKLKDKISSDGELGHVTAIFTRKRVQQALNDGKRPAKLADGRVEPLLSLVTPLTLAETLQVLRFIPPEIVEAALAEMDATPTEDAAEDVTE